MEDTRVKQALLQRTLQNLSLSDDLLLTFQKFLRTGTLSQRRQLLLDGCSLESPVVDEYVTLPGSHSSKRARSSTTKGNGIKRCHLQNTSCVGTPEVKDYQPGKHFTGDLRAAASDIGSVDWDGTPDISGSDSASAAPVSSLKTYDLSIDASLDFSADIACQEWGFVSPLSTSETTISMDPSLDPTETSLLGFCLSPWPTDLSKASIPNILAVAHVAFESQLGYRKDHAQALVRAVQGLLEAPEPACDLPESIWGSRSSIFGECTAASSTDRLRRLYEGHHRIKKWREEYACAARFCYIYLHHDIEQLLRTEDLELSHGRGRMTAALVLQAATIGLTVDAVRAERKAGRNYMHLLMHGGPGFVLQVGRNVSTIWERKLSKGDITLILNFLRTRVPEIYQTIESFNSIAARALINGFLAYGWSRREILETNSSVFTELRRHIAIEEAYGIDEYFLPASASPRNLQSSYLPGNTSPSRSHTDYLSDPSDDMDLSIRSEFAETTDSKNTDTVGTKSPFTDVDLEVLLRDDGGGNHVQLYDFDDFELLNSVLDPPANMHMAPSTATGDGK
ncbi:hypothetical protein ZTR_10659 [Talaromyces verruculosus]|nr:hypothetical protein ZTR_10659 [Talaromyces verruculosus]